MKDPLIFTEQRLSPRLIDILLTVLAWVGFVYLFTMGLSHFAHNDPKPFFPAFISEPGSIVLYIAIAIFNAFLLIGWAKYNQRRFRTERRRHRPVLTQAEIAQSFIMEQNLLDVLRQSKISSITYDNQGHITSIDKNVSI